MNVIDQWIPIADGFYEVHKSGAIRRAVAGISTYVGRIVSPVRSATGYCQVQLCFGGTKPSIRAYVHRVVTEAFLGPCPVGHVVNHRDLNKQNNALSNLEYVTFSDNVRHAKRSGRGRAKAPMTPRPLKGRPTGASHWTSRMPDRIATGDRMPHTKLTDAQVSELRTARVTGVTYREIAARFGISQGHAHRIANGLRRNR